MRAQRDSKHLGTICQKTALQFVTEMVDQEASPLNPDMLCVIMIQSCRFILSLLLPCVGLGAIFLVQGILIVLQPSE